MSLPLNSNIKKIMKTENIRNKGILIKADIYSRPNAISGKYKACQVGLDNLEEIKDSDIFFLETLKVRADSADKIIAETEQQGRDITDPNVMKMLGEKINALGKPIHRSESVMIAVIVSLQLMAYYGIAAGIWGLVLRKNFLMSGFCGVIAALLISLLFILPVVACQRTKERIRNIVDGINLIWGNLGIIIGILGLLVFVIKSII